MITGTQRRRVLTSLWLVAAAFLSAFAMWPGFVFQFMWLPFALAGVAAPLLHLAAVRDSRETALASLGAALLMALLGNALGTINLWSAAGLAEHPAKANALRGVATEASVTMTTMLGMLLAWTLLFLFASDRASRIVFGAFAVLLSVLVAPFIAMIVSGGVIAHAGWVVFAVCGALVAVGLASALTLLARGAPRFEPMLMASLSVVAAGTTFLWFRGVFVGTAFGLHTPGALTSVLGF